MELVEAMSKSSVDILITYFNWEDIEGHCSHCQTVMKAKERLLTYSGVGKCTHVPKGGPSTGEQGERSELAQCQSGYGRTARVQQCRSDGTDDKSVVEEEVS